MAMELLQQKKPFGELLSLDTHLRSNGNGSINGKAKPVEPIVDELEERQLALEEEMQKLKEQKKAREAKIEADKLAMIEAAQNKVKLLRDEVKELRHKAIEAKKNGNVADEKLYREAILDTEGEALEIENKYQFAEPSITVDEPIKKNKFWEKYHNLAWAISLFIMFISIFACYFTVMHYKEVIQATNAKNAATDNLTQMLGNPYDESSIQKIFYDTLVQLSDAPKFFVFLLILVPYVAIYLLPFIKTEKDAWTDFFSEMTAYQRQLVALGWSAVLLFSIALYHLGK